ncbi:MAG: VTC domain-containing protein [Propionibacteriaceae bacterium]|jgi:hypothetical protein|nr:VTC domain-containing protein [Propionibacteriaceae bacterium]
MVRDTHPAGDLIKALPEVSLAALNASAELLNRYDRKYLVPIQVLNETLAEVADAALALDIGGRRRMRYRTVYYDTADWLCYRLTATRRRRRFKVRMREYESGECYLEVKTNGARGHTMKERWAVTGDGPGGTSDITSRVPSQLTETVARYLALRAITAPPLDAFAAALEVRYDRSTLLLGGGRVTIDSGLEWDAPGRLMEAGDTTRAVDAAVPLVVVETKTSGATTALDQALWRRGIRPVALSKFGIGMARIYGFPGNRWHRVLQLL